MRQRRGSNEIASTTQLDQLRKLQSQLSIMIQDANNESLLDSVKYPAVHVDGSTPSGSPISLRPDSSSSRNWERASGSSTNSWELGISERLGDDAYDIESGLPNFPATYEMRSPSSQTVDDTTYLRPSVVKSTVEAETLSIVNSDGMPESTGETNATGSHQSTIPTVGTSSSGSSVDLSERSIKSRWSRASQGRGSFRNPSRSVSRSLSRRGSSMRLSAIFSTEAKRYTENGENPRWLPNYDFLSNDKEAKEDSSLRPSAKWWHGVFLFSFISMLACIITLWAPYPIGARMSTDIIATMPWSDGCQGLQSCICPRETICADDLASMILLTIARSSAWFDYPLYMLLFMSKAKNLNNFLQKTALRCWINFSDYHRVHSLFGIIVGIESASHSFFHILRWARRKDDIQLLWTSKTGISGFVALIIVPFVVLPMTVPYLKNQMRFEWRKALHYLSIVWAAALVCHAPQRIFWLIGVPLCIYTADKVVEGLFKTHLVESAHFQRMGDTSCLISFENPPGFGKQNSAYVHLMLPWLSKSQFHAFTVFPGTKPNHSSICIQKCGDWTDKLMKTITTPTHKPAFVVGPFLSPFSSPAMDSENLVAVASGIGVTPAISLIKQYSSTSRRLNLVWICRDAGLIEHFLQNVEFGSDGYTLIYYTGKERGVILRDDLPPNIFMFNGRPNLERTISGIIASIATGEGLPEKLHSKVLTRTPAKMRSNLLLEKACSIYTLDQLFNYTVKASNHYNQGLETLVDTVNYQGILSTMKHLLGDDLEDVRDKITKNFKKVDTDADGHMNRGGFELFFVLMLVGTHSEEVTNIKSGLKRISSCRDMFESGGGTAKLDESEGPWKDEFGIKKYLQGDGKFSAKNWNMLYCGGSQPVLDQLKTLKRNSGIGLSVEKFDW